MNTALKLFLGKYGIIFVLISFALMRMGFLDVWPTFDGAFYMGALLRAIDTFNLSWDGWSHFRLAGHPSLGYASLMALGQLADPGNLHLLHFENLLLALIGIYSFYKITQYFYNEYDSTTAKIEVLLITFIFAFNPLFFGTSIDLNLDFPIIVFLAVCVAALLYGKLLLFAVAGTLLVFTKETGAMLYTEILLFFTIAMGRDLVVWNGPPIKIFWKANRRQSCFLDPTFRTEARTMVTRAICLLIPGFLFFIYLVSVKDALWLGNKSLSLSATPFNSFGFVPKYIWIRLLEFFILNFSWIPSLAIACFLIKAIFMQRKDLFFDFLNPRHRVIGALLLTEVGFLMFNMAFVTYVIPRYIVPSVLFLLIFFFCALKSLFHNAIARMMVLTVVAILFFVQTFRTVDPLSKIVFGTFNFGNHKMLNLGTKSSELSYNAEFVMINRVLNQAYKALANRPSMDITVYDNWPGFLGVFEKDKLLIDRQTWKATSKTSAGFRPNIFFARDWSKSDTPPTEAIYVTQPWHFEEKTELDFIMKFYSIVNTVVVDDHGYSCKVLFLRINTMG